MQNNMQNMQNMIQSLMLKMNTLVPDPTAGELSVDVSVAPTDTAPGAGVSGSASAAYPDNDPDADDVTGVPGTFGRAKPMRAASTTPYGS
jgi:hypothetical protein